MNDRNPQPKCAICAHEPAAHEGRKPWPCRIRPACPCTGYRYPGYGNVAYQGAEDAAPPSTTDEEPWVYPADDDEDRGLWLGALLLVVALVIGFVIGRMTA